MPIYSIRHVLPDDTIAGYHGDSACSITQNKHSAKTTPETTHEKAVDWLKRVRQNFEFAWNDEEEYRSSPCWKGYGLDQIRTELEERPELAGTQRPLRWAVM